MMALTDVAMLPALNVMHRNRRHFELFIGVFHLIISIIFNITGALDTELFLDELEWHFISDVLSITYGLMISIHLMGIQSEEINTILRYVAFGASWILKTRDQWDSIFYESFLILVFVLGVLYRHFIIPKDGKVPVHMGHATKMAISLAGFGLAAGVDRLELFEDVFHITYGVFHVLGGLAVYHAWLMIPCRDTKKNDDVIPTYGGGYR